MNDFIAETASTNKKWNRMAPRGNPFASSGRPVEKRQAEYLVMASFAVKSMSRIRSPYYLPVFSRRL